MGARILTMPATKLAVDASWRTSLGMPSELAPRIPGPFLIFRREENDMSRQAKVHEASIEEAQTRAHRRRATQDTLVQAQRIVAEVRAAVARNPEFAPFADRPASDLLSIGVEAPTSTGWTRLLRSMGLGARPMKFGASAAR